MPTISLQYFQPGGTPQHGVLISPSILAPIAEGRRAIAGGLAALGDAAGRAGGAMAEHKQRIASAYNRSQLESLEQEFSETKARYLNESRGAQTPEAIAAVRGNWQGKYSEFRGRAGKMIGALEGLQSGEAARLLSRFDHENAMFGISLEGVQDGLRVKASDVSTRAAVDSSVSVEGTAAAERTSSALRERALGVRAVFESRKAADAAIPPLKPAPFPEQGADAVGDLGASFSEKRVRDLRSAAALPPEPREVDMVADFDAGAALVGEKVEERVRLGLVSPEASGLELKRAQEAYRERYFADLAAQEPVLAEHALQKLSDSGKRGVLGMSPAETQAALAVLRRARDTAQVETARDLTRRAALGERLSNEFIDRLLVSERLSPEVGGKLKEAQFERVKNSDEYRSKVLGEVDAAVEIYKRVAAEPSASMENLVIAETNARYAIARLPREEAQIWTDVFTFSIKQPLLQAGESAERSAAFRQVDSFFRESIISKGERDRKAAMAHNEMVRQAAKRNAAKNKKGQQKPIVDEVKEVADAEKAALADRVRYAEAMHRFVTWFVEREKKHRLDSSKNARPSAVEYFRELNAAAPPDVQLSAQRAAR